MKPSNLSPNLEPSFYILFLTNRENFELVLLFSSKKSLVCHFTQKRSSLSERLFYGRNSCLASNSSSSIPQKRKVHVIKYKSAKKWGKMSTEDFLCPRDYQLFASAQTLTFSTGSKFFTFWKKWQDLCSRLLQFGVREKKIWNKKQKKSSRVKKRGWHFFSVAIASVEISKCQNNGMDRRLVRTLKKHPLRSATTLVYR
jgi:hypothetical protein